MNKKTNELLNDLAEKHTERFLEEENELQKRAKTLTLRRRVTILVAAALVIALVAVPLAVVFANRAPTENPTTEPTTGDLTTPDDPEIEDYEKGSSLIGKGTVKERGAGYVIKTLPLYDKKTVEMRVNYSTLDPAAVSVLGFDAETDAGLEIFSQWYSSIISFDFPRHFSLYQQPFVDKEFTARVEKLGYTYDMALAKLDEILSPLNIQPTYIVYNLTGVRDITEEFKIYLVEYLNVFAEVGLDFLKVTKIYEYSVENIKYSFNGGNPNLQIDTPRMITYCYDGEWYLYYTTMFGYEASAYLYEDNIKMFSSTGWITGEVTKVQDGYICLDTMNGKHTLLTTSRPDLKIGDIIKANVYCAEGLTIGEQTPYSVSYLIHGLIGYEVVTDKPLTVIPEDNVVKFAVAQTGSEEPMYTKNSYMEDIVLELLKKFEYDAVPDTTGVEPDQAELIFAITAFYENGGSAHVWFYRGGRVTVRVGGGETVSYLLPEYSRAKVRTICDQLLHDLKTYDCEIDEDL